MRSCFWALGVLVLFSCQNDIGEVGFKNPNRNFEVVAKEFIIPSKVFLMDSLSTSNGIISVNTSNGAKYTMPRSALLVGTIEDPRFGKSTATAYTAFTPSGFPYLGDKGYAVYESAELTMALDYNWYWAGSTTASSMNFQVHELTDSLLTYLKYYNFSTTPTGRFLGETVKATTVDPDVYDKNFTTNNDLVSTEQIYDTINVKLDDAYGRELFEALADTVGDDEYDFVNFRKFRRKFNGIAISSTSTDKIIAFNPDANIAATSAEKRVKSRITIKYAIVTDTTIHYQYDFLFSNPGQNRSTAEYMGYTNITTDRSGTPLAGLTNKYESFTPVDGNMYVQAGTNVGLSLDFSEVFEYFKTISTKALSVAEVRIEGESQRQAPRTFKLRALNADNREKKTSKPYTDIAGDEYQDADIDFYRKHLIVTGTAASPYFRADVLGDNGGELSLIRSSSNGKTVYTGYITNFLQQELSLTEADQLRYYALVPQVPDVARGVNGYYFPDGSIKLTVFYTVPKSDN